MSHRLPCSTHTSNVLQKLLLVMSGIKAVTESALGKNWKESVTAVVVIGFPYALAEDVFASVH